VAALLLGTTQAESASLANCTDSQLVPRVAELSASQGAPGYTRLARGKETLVRAYLTTPTTCTVTNRQSITPVSARVQVSYSGGFTAPAQTTQTCGSPAGTCSNYAPLSGKLGATVQTYSGADPIFVVPDFYLAPSPTNTDAFDITFTLRVTYNRTTSGGTTTLTTTGTETNAIKTVSVDRKTNALRVLVVPMGDPTSATPQWTTSANTPSGSAEEVLQNVMTNAARALPVPTGAIPRLTTGTTGGIRYVVSTALLDARSLGLMNSGKFCANGGNWSTTQVSTGSFEGHTLKGDLLQRLGDYNQFNTPPADMVLGVVDGAIAAKSTDTTPSGCDDGRASTPASGAAGQVAWVRISRDAYPTPLQMELMHPFGIVKPTVSASFHSPAVEADAAAPGRGYNVLQRKVVDAVTGALGTNDHSIMNYNTTNIPYTKDNTLLEPRDWKDALCDLGGLDSVTSACTLSTALGTSEGVAANDAMYQISGVLTGSDSLRVTDGKVAAGDADFPMGVVDGSSPLRLLLYSDCNGTSLLKDVPLATFGGEGHDALDGHVDQETTGDSFGALVPLTGLTGTPMRAELQLNGVSKFSASACDAAPDVLSTTETAQGTAAPGTIVSAFDFPVNGNGRAIAFDGIHLYATLVGGDTVYKLETDGDQVSTFDVGEILGALAWNPTTGHLYGGDYTGANVGSVYDIDPGNIVEGQAVKTTLFTFNEEASCIGGSNQIDGLEYRPTATNLAISGDICDTVFFKKLNGEADGQFGTDNNSGITTDGGGGLWLARLTQGNAEHTQLTHVDASGAVLGDDLILPGYAAEDLAYDSVTFAPTCVVWANQATFAQPRPEIRAIAVPCGGGGGGTGAVGVQTENARFVSLQFTCGDPGAIADERPTFTVANGLVPGTEDAVVAPYTDDLFCGESPGKIIASASNGWTSTGLNDPQATETVTGTAVNPTASIASPLNGAKFRRGEFVHYEGSAFDAFDSAITGSGLKWFDDKPSPHQIGEGASFDRKIANDAPLGDHKITLTATDGNGNSASVTVTISVLPAVCPSTFNCP
jgi:hypothetical protein